MEDNRTSAISVQNPVLSMTRILDRVLAYIALTKPVIQFLLLLTAATAMVLEGSLVRTPGRMVLALLLLTMSGGAAKTFNQILERQDDKLMERTRCRPLPSGQLSLPEALVFGSILFTISTILLWVVFNPRCAALAAGTVVFYSFVYTLYLKRRTHWNVVIGGLAGSMAPVIGWAVTGSQLTLMPFLLAALVFVWTPPHFWALALYHIEDYRQAPYPILPVTKDETATWRYIFTYSILTIAISLVIGANGHHSLYFPVAILAGIAYIVGTILARRSNSPSAPHRLFVLSIIYLLLLCAGLIVEALLG
jgi:protoheme IX farnesyltransferase